MQVRDALTERMVLVWSRAKLTASADTSWYLHAFDLESDDWRVFRLDRIREPRASTLRFTPRDAPDSLEAVRQARAYQPGEPMQLRILAPLSEVRERMPVWLCGEFAAESDATTLLSTRGDPHWVCRARNHEPLRVRAGWPTPTRRGRRQSRVETRPRRHRREPP